jgi:hypothetical protein
MVPLAVESALESALGSAFGSALKAKQPTRWAWLKKLRQLWPRLALQSLMV